MTMFLFLNILYIKLWCIPPKVSEIVKQERGNYLFKNNLTFQNYIFRLAQGNDTREQVVGRPGPWRHHHCLAEWSIHTGRQ